MLLNFIYVKWKEENTVWDLLELALKALLPVKNTKL